MTMALPSNDDTSSTWMMVYPVTLLLLLWFVQPWGLRVALSVRHHARLACAAWAVTTAAVSGQVARHWHASTPVVVPPRMVLALLYMPLGLQVLRYAHAAVVGVDAFQRHFGLLTRTSINQDDWQWRLCVFMWCTPTVIFRDDKPKDEKLTHLGVTIAHCRPDNPHWSDLGLACLADLLHTVALCSAVLVLTHDDDDDTCIPYVMQITLRVLIMGTSVALFRLLLEVPVRYALQGRACVRRIVPIYHQPLAATCPRDFWHRWSTAVGYHLRGAFYEPYYQQPSWYGKYHKWLLASVPFGVNALLHIYWWSWAVKGQADYSYIVLLIVFPLTTLALQDVIVTVWPDKTSRLRAWILRVVLWVGWASVAETMQVANGAPLTLRDVCRSNLLLPKETS